MIHSPLQVKEELRYLLAEIDLSLTLGIQMSRKRLESRCFSNGNRSLMNRMDKHVSVLRQMCYYCGAGLSQRIRRILSLNDALGYITHFVSCRFDIIPFSYLLLHSFPVSKQFFQLTPTNWDKRLHRLCVGLEDGILMSY